MKTSRFSDAQIIAILKQAESGSPIPELCREHGDGNPRQQQAWRNNPAAKPQPKAERYSGVGDDGRHRVE